jgi:hypothetical protein
MTQITSEFEAAAMPPQPNHRTESRPQPAVVIQMQDHKAAGGPKAPRGIVWVRLAEDGDYSEHQVKVRTRYPEVLNDELATNDFSRHKAFIKQMVLEHNDWLDPDMDQPTPLPPVDTTCDLSAEDAQSTHVVGQPWCCFWHAISLDELLMILAAWGTERKKLQVSLPGTKSS